MKQTYGEEEDDSIPYEIQFPRGGTAAPSERERAAREMGGGERAEGVSVCVRVEIACL